MLLVDQLSEAQRSIIDQIGPKMDVTNVADYYYHHEKETWAMDDFPMPRPPFKSMWVEYRYPKSVWSRQMGSTAVQSYGLGLTPYFGCFISDSHVFSAKEKSLLIQDPDHEDHTPGQFGMYGGMWYVDGRGKPVRYGLDVSARFDIGEDGKISKFYFLPNMGNTDDERATNCYYLHPILMAFSFANCKNIEVVEVRVPRKLQKARERRGRRPLVTYKVINVLPFGKTYKQSARSVESDGRGVALHIRAGNFARYGEAHGRGKLFGRLSGMFWRPQSVVGSAERGTSVHDYAASAPED